MEQEREGAKPDGPTQTNDIARESQRGDLELFRHIDYLQNYGLTELFLKSAIATEKDKMSYQLA